VRATLVPGRHLGEVVGVVPGQLQPAGGERSLAGPRSPRNRSASWACHCSAVVAARSAWLTLARGTLANQTVPPSGSTT
jgi:hypothetical protein